MNESELEKPGSSWWEDAGVLFPGEGEREGGEEMMNNGTEQSQLQPPLPLSHDLPYLINYRALL